MIEKSLRKGGVASFIVDAFAAFLALRAKASLRLAGRSQLVDFRNVEGVIDCALTKLLLLQSEG